MRARKISILLAITAISALTLFVVSLPTCSAEAAVMVAVPDTLLGYEEKVIVGPDGNDRVEITAVVGRGGVHDLLLPFDFDDGTDFSIPSGPAAFRRDANGQAPPTIMVLGHRMLNLASVATAMPGDTIRVSAAVPDWFKATAASRPYGESFVERRFVNFSAFVLRQPRVSVVLPEGMLVHSIEKVMPEYSPKKNPQPPFEVARLGNRGMAALTVAQMKPTDSIQLSVNVRPSRRGLIPLFGGLAMACLYLIFFRDVLKPPKEA